MEELTVIGHAPRRSFINSICEYSKSVIRVALCLADLILSLLLFLTLSHLLISQDSQAQWHIVAAQKEFIRSGLVDELHLVYSPVFLGSGENLFSGIDMPKPIALIPGFGVDRNSQFDYSVSTFETIITIDVLNHESRAKSF